MAISDLAPIELNFYNEQDEIEKTYRRSRIPSYLLDMAIGLQEGLSGDSVDQSNVDALFNFIVEFYGGQFSIEDLKRKTDLLECMTVLRNILARANNLMRGFTEANPPRPSPRRKSTTAGDGS